MGVKIDRIVGIVPLLFTTSPGPDDELGARLRLVPPIDGPELVCCWRTTIARSSSRHGHVLALSSLAPIHRDPFDRMPIV
jgi:hypothetical protein